MCRYCFISQVQVPKRIASSVACRIPHRKMARIQVNLLEVQGVPRDEDHSVQFYCVRFGLDGDFKTSEQRQSVFSEIIEFTSDTATHKTIQMTLMRVSPKSELIPIASAVLEAVPGALAVDLKNDDGKSAGKVLLKIEVDESAPVPPKPGAGLFKFFADRGWILYILALVVAAGCKIAFAPPADTPGLGLPVGKIAFAAGSSLNAGNYIASCVGTSAKVCVPYCLAMQEDGNLVLYKGPSPAEQEGSVWSSKTKKKRRRSAFLAAMGSGGMLNIKQGTNVLLSTNVTSSTEFSELVQF